MRIQDRAQFDKENVFGLGQPNTAYAQYFTGNSYLNPLTEAGKETSNEWCEPVDDAAYNVLA